MRASDIIDRFGEDLLSAVFLRCEVHNRHSCTHVTHRHLPQGFVNCARDCRTEAYAFLFVLFWRSQTYFITTVCPFTILYIVFPGFACQKPLTVGFCVVEINVSWLLP